MSNKIYRAYESDRKFKIEVGTNIFTKLNKHITDKELLNFVKIILSKADEDDIMAGYKEAFPKDNMFLRHGTFKVEPSKDAWWNKPENSPDKKWKLID